MSRLPALAWIKSHSSWSNSSQTIKLTPTLIAFFMPRGKQTSRTLPDFRSCFVKRASRRPEPLSLRRYHRLPETIPAPAAQPPSRPLQCAPVVLLLSISESAASVQLPPISAARRLGNTGTHNASPRFRMLAKCCGFKTRNAPAGRVR
jgi:hypothetical protein